MPRIRALVHAAYAKWVPRIGREPRPMLADYTLAVREHTIDLLEQDGELVALIETIAQADHLFVENVAVQPEHQGRGFGRRLLAHAEAAALRLGLSEVRLLTNAAFESNVALYSGLGYRIDREEALAGGGTVVHTTKRLSAQG